MSEPQEGYDLNQIPDTRPTPDIEAADHIDGESSSDVQRFAAAVGAMPPIVAHAICRAIGRLESIDNLGDIARVSGVSVRTLQRYIQAAAKAEVYPPGLGSPNKEAGGGGDRRASPGGATNAGKPGVKPKNDAKQTRKPTAKALELFIGGGNAARGSNVA